MSTEMKTLTICGTTYEIVDGQARSTVSSLSDEIANIQSGKDGIGIESIVQTETSTEDGGANVVTVTKTDGTSSTFYVKNGSKGSTGESGYTPVKGTDYWTEEDKTSIVEDVLNSMTNLDEVSY